MGRSLLCPINYQTKERQAFKGKVILQWHNQGVILLKWCQEGEAKGKENPRDEKNLKFPTSFSPEHPGHPGVQEMEVYQFRRGVILPGHETGGKEENQSSEFDPGLMLIDW